MRGKYFRTNSFHIFTYKKMLSSKDLQTEAWLIFHVLHSG